MLDKVKQVDGSGSGLDADLLDGKDSSSLVGAMLSANISGIGLNLAYFGAVNGVSTGNSDETVNQSLSPGIPVVVSHLRVLLTAAPGGGSSRFIYLRVNGSMSALSCSIADAATTCSSDAEATVPPGARLSVSVGNTGGFPASTSVLVGMTARPQ